MESRNDRGLPRSQQAGSFPGRGKANRVATTSFIPLQLTGPDRWRCEPWLQLLHVDNSKVSTVPSQDFPDLSQLGLLAAASTDNTHSTLPLTKNELSDSNLKAEKCPLVAPSSGAWPGWRCYGNSVPPVNPITRSAISPKCQQRATRLVLPWPKQGAKLLWFSWNR